MIIILSYFQIGDLLISHPGSDDLKICDFGLARRIAMGRLAPLHYGVPEYVSPETANGEGVGLATDMWSLGIITYILLSGISPFRGKDDRETLTKVRSGMFSFKINKACIAFEKTRIFLQETGNSLMNGGLILVAKHKILSANC